MMKKTTLLILALMAVVGSHAMATVDSAVNDSDDNFTDYYKEPYEDPNLHIYTSFIDYTDLARQITEGCTTNYQKIRAIYQWVCTNIDYDTTYGIYKADSCLVTRRGVCQAYCELFYQIAKSIGIRVEVIGGKSKNHVGFISGAGHSWIFAYTRENRGIFMDPTWGAGILEDHQFVRNKDCWGWFNVEPEWLILSHFPDAEHYQMMERPLTFEEFRALPLPNNLWRIYGLDTHDLFQRIRDNSLSLPKFYNSGEGEFQILSMPMSASLRIGEYYQFRIRVKPGRQVVVRNNSVYNMTPDWVNEGNGVYAIGFMVRDVGTLNIGLNDPVKPNFWNHMLEYTIEQPTADDWAKVEKVYPLCVPDAKRVQNLLADKWQQAGIDGQQMLKLIREQHITALPVLYDDKGQRLKVETVPMTKFLQAGETYTFSFKPLTGTDWVIVNEGKWYREWEKNDGIYTMTVKPKAKGSLRLATDMKGNNTYWTCLEYDVR